MHTKSFCWSGWETWFVNYFKDYSVFRVEIFKNIYIFQNYTSEVYSLPMMTAPISPHLFILPEHKDFMPLLPSDIFNIRKAQSKQQDSSPRGIEYTDLPREAQLQYKVIISSG